MGAADCAVYQWCAMTHEAWRNRRRESAEIKSQSQWAHLYSEFTYLYCEERATAVGYLPTAWTQFFMHFFNLHIIGSPVSVFLFSFLTEWNYLSNKSLSGNCHTQILQGCGLVSQTSLPMKPLSRWLWRVGPLESSIVLSSFSSSLTLLGECLFGLV